MNALNYYYNKDLKELACELRLKSTKAEIKLWKEVLRAGKMHDFTFLRQRPVLKYIADFMCKDLWLIIEVDGYTHGFQKRWQLDKRRQRELEAIGFCVLRFSDEEVMNDIRNVERSIESFVLNHPPAHPGKCRFEVPPSKGDGFDSLKGRKKL